MTREATQTHRSVAVLKLPNKVSGLGAIAQPMGDVHDGQRDRIMAAAASRTVRIPASVLAHEDDVRRTGRRRSSDPQALRVVGHER
jgi:hypothetical protein